MFIACQNLEPVDSEHNSFAHFNNLKTNFISSFCPVSAIALAVSFIINVFVVSVFAQVGKSIIAYYWNYVKIFLKLFQYYVR